MSNTCRTCTEWVNWKKTNETMADPLRSTPAWNAETAVLGRCRLTDKMSRGDVSACSQYTARAIEVKVAAD